jgi:hypothetical protein
MNSIPKVRVSRERGWIGRLRALLHWRLFRGRPYGLSRALRRTVILRQFYDSRQVAVGGGFAGLLRVTVQRVGRHQITKKGKFLRTRMVGDAAGSAVGA